MYYYVTPQQMKVIEKNSDDSGVTFKELMYNAGLKTAQFVTSLSLELSYGIVILVGNGNNGGDGFVTAKLLSEFGFPVTVVLMCGEPTTRISTEAYCDLESTSVDVLTINDNQEKIFLKISAASLILDAVFGIGFHGELPPQVASCLGFIKCARAAKVAVDIPSGANAVTGEVDPATLKCDYTLTFQSEKLGMQLYPLKRYCGTVIVTDIGIDQVCYCNISHPILPIDRADIQKILPERFPWANKGDFGKLVNISGSRRMPGAAALSTLSALRCGVGLNTTATVKTVSDSLSSSIFETTWLPLKETLKGEISSTNIKEILSTCDTATAVIIGCGLGLSEDTIKLVTELIQLINVPIILDADGLNCIASSIDILKNRKAKLIVTPHPAELARLLNISKEEAIRNRYDCAVELSKNYGITVVAKGSPTIIVGENGFCFVNSTGNAGLSRGGSGDVLTGMIGSFLAQGISPTDAAVAGVYLHGLAADRICEVKSMQGMLPSDVINELPFLFKQLNR